MDSDSQSTLQQRLCIHMGLTSTTSLAYPDQCGMESVCYIGFSRSVFIDSSDGIFFMYETIRASCPWDPNFVHFNGQLKKIVKTLALSFGFGGSVTPHISLQVSRDKMMILANLHSMSPDENSVSVRILVHRDFELFSQIFFERCILDDWDTQCIVEAQHARLIAATRDCLDLLNVADLEQAVLAMQFLDQQRDKDCPLTVRVNRACGTPLKRCQK